MAETTIGDRTERTPILDRTINLAAVSWSTLAWIAIFLVAIALRLPQLGLHTLSPGEAHLADDGYRLFRGATTGPNNQIGNVGPVPVVLNGLAIFLFGASDAAARIVPGILGIMMVAAVCALRPVIGNARALGAGALLALSPTAVYLSRTASRETFVAAFALFALVAFVRIGVATDEGGVRRWAVLFGASLGLMYGSGPSSLSVLLAIVLGVAATTLLDRRETNAFTVSLNRLAGARDAILFFLAGLAIALVAGFSLLFTDFSGLAGLGSTVADWGRLLSTASSATPTQFFLLAILLYEILAVLFAVVTASRTATIAPARLPWTFFAIWFAAALIVFSFSSGSIPDHAIHVALPLVILGGFGLGETIAELDPRAIFSQRIGLLLLLLIGFFVAVFSLLVLLGRIGNARDQNQAVVEALAAFVLAVFPLGFGVYLVVRDELAAHRRRHVAGIALLAVGTILALFTLRSTIELSFFNADESSELLAQQTSTPAVKQIVRRITNLSRDFTLTAGSARDPGGGHGLSIAIDKSIQWPYRWYFRSFPDATVVAPGQAPQSGAQIVIAPDDTGMAEASYTPQAFPAKNRVPGNYSAPQFGDILKDIFFPSHWERGAKFLLFRTGITAAEPETVTVGMVGELSNAVTPNTGPFGLFDQVGAGNGRGQFNQPRGIAVSPDGEQIYVVDMSNARVEHFDATGQFIDVWGGGDGSALAFGTANGGLGPTGIAVGPDGLIYVCDTWNHKIVVLDESGRVVRSFGQFGDTQDAADATQLTGSFFGPRAIAVYNDEIYVVDTGNERVQVFSLDGTFVRSWGGNGTGDTQFVEPVGIAIDGQGRVYVADSGNARIGVFTTAGAPLAEWPVAAWQGNLYFEPYLALDDNGFLYATSSATGGIEVFDQSGQLVTEVHQVGSTRLQQPVGIAWSPEGDMLVSDKGRNAVFRLTPGTLPPAEENTGDLTGGEASPEASPGGDEAGVAEPPASPEVLVESSPVGASPVAASPTAAASPAEPTVLAPLSGASPAASPRGSPLASPVASPVASPSPTATVAGNG